MPLLHPSGGVVYHLRAWRYGKTLWPGFHSRVRDWLTAWRPENDHLVLVGPSGGYALDAAFLARFPRLTALEPDRLACRLLRHRFPQIRFRFDTDFDLAKADGFHLLAKRYPDAAFLLCNLLGQQLVGQGAGFDRRAWRADLEPALTGRAWASWHDLVSTHRAPDNMEAIALERAEPLEALLGRFWQGGDLAIYDHECDGLAPEAPREYALWALRPGQYHLVEWLAFK